MEALPRGVRRSLPLVGALLSVIIVVGGAQQTGSLLHLITPGVDGPAADVIQQDFPDAELGGGVGHDGQQFYAIARQPMHLDDAAASLDRPRYRSQRILMPLAAWALHPQGGGPGLVVAIVVIGALAVALGTWAMTQLSMRFGGHPLVGMAFPLLPGVLAAFRISAADGLALALVLAAIDASLGDRHRRAVLLGIAAVLAKESSLLVLVCIALWRRDRAGAMLAAIPGATAVSWAIWLRLTIPSDDTGITEFGPPFVGVRDSWDLLWSHGDRLSGIVVLVVTYALGIAALRRGGMATPLNWVVAVHLVFFTALSVSVIGLPYNSTRATAPAMACALIVLLSPKPAAVALAAPTGARDLAT